MLLKNCRFIVTQNQKREILETCDILIENNKIKKIITPKRTYNEIVGVKPLVCTACGSKCKTASPNNAPAERPTKTSKNVFSLLLLKNKEKTPTREIRETIMTLSSVYVKTLSIYSKAIVVI